LLSALHAIKCYPPDLANPVFAHYPAMKFGERRSVEHFTQLLAPLAQRMIAGSRGRECVLTSPPVGGLPSGANLLCAGLQARLGGIEAVPLRLAEPQEPYESDAEFEAYGDYAKLDYKTRRLCQFKDDEIAFDGERIRGRDVIFVNDINVTGSQMRRMRDVLSKARPHRIHWLLILNVAGRIGRRFPHLENEINHSRFSGQDELISFLRRSELCYTGKFVARLLSFGTSSLERIFLSIDGATRRGIARAIAAEGSYSGETFREKIALAGQI
jgi:pyrimidine operon attenuation protein/uracil phosphoribosyltransferase